MNAATGVPHTQSRAERIRQHQHRRIGRALDFDMDRKAAGSTNGMVLHRQLRSLIDVFDAG